MQISGRSSVRHRRWNGHGCMSSGMAERCSCAARVRAFPARALGISHQSGARLGGGWCINSRFSGTDTSRRRRDLAPETKATTHPSPQSVSARDPPRRNWWRRSPLKAARWILTTATGTTGTAGARGDKARALSRPVTACMYRDRFLEPPGRPGAEGDRSGRPGELN